MLKIGIAGLGSIFGVHLKAIESIPDVQLVAVCDSDIRKKDKVSGVNFYTDVEQMLKSEKLDCLHICLPHHLHVPVTLLAAEHGVHVFAEKPVGINEKDILALSEIKNQIKVGVCFQNRYNNTITELQKLLSSQKYGAVKGCKAVVTWDRSQGYYDKDPWRATIGESGGGVMLSQAIHTIDLMYILMGSVKWIKAMTGNLLLEDIEVEDTACAHMEFENGTKGIFYTTVTHCNNSSVEIELVCEEAVLKIIDGKLTLHQQSKEVELFKDENITYGKAYYGSNHRTAISKFYEAIIADSGEYINIDEATWSVRIIDGAIESSKTGKRVYLR